MMTSKSQLLRILAVVSIGLAACGVKLWADYYAKPSVVYSNESYSSEAPTFQTDISVTPVTTSIPVIPSLTLPEATGPQQIPVYLCGAVLHPGIYQIDSGTYLYEVIDTAGGLLPEAASQYINLVFHFTEAVSVYIPTEEEMQAFLDGENSAASEFLRNGLIQGIWGKGTGSEQPGDGSVSTQTAALININSADQTQLETLPGVGEATAKAIIAYREKSGGFVKIEDIMNVAGIKEGRFEALREFITV